MFIKGFKNQFDAWSGWHFFGAYFLCDFIGPAWTIAAALFWELADFSWSLAAPHVCKEKCWIDSVFDRRGASWVDLVLGLISVIIWFLFN